MAQYIGDKALTHTIYGGLLKDEYQYYPAWFKGLLHV